MDTRLKNSRRLGMIILIAAILLGTTLVMAAYPWLKTQAYLDARTVTEQMVQQGQTAGYSVMIGGTWYDFEDTWHFRYMLIWIMMAAFSLMGLAVFIVGLIKPFGLTERKWATCPFEIVLFVGYLAFCFVMEGLSYMTGPTEFVWYSVTGEFAQELQTHLQFSPDGAGGVVLACNVLLWLVLFVFEGWLIISMESVFTLGFRRWFQERTLVGNVFLWIKNAGRKLCRAVEAVDFRDKPTRLMVKIVVVNFLALSVMSMLWFYGIFGIFLYSVALFFVMRRIYGNIQEKYAILLDAAGRMAEGDLEVEIQENLGVFEPLKGEIARIQGGFRKAVEAEVRSRSMKTELITNVSHDLKTPLTAIITYVNLLKEKDITPQERDSYIQVLDQKSMRLKSLIEDLFEISKANSNNVTLNLMDVDVVSLMKQVRLEMDDKIALSGIDFRFQLPEHKVILRLDSDKTYRIFENLLVNIVKYGLAGTRAYVEIEENEKQVVISMKNISAAELSGEQDLTERFVRGDASRNTEGSGLGLAIAGSFTKLQKGEMEVSVEADLFKVCLMWRKSGEKAE